MEPRRALCTALEDDQESLYRRVMAYDEFCAMHKLLQRMDGDDLDL
ncbi:MAG: hypothetical protein LBR38_03320 [Synergistaceae bacterium]|jgi:hypothetical protein|nr:hypothetical protein [Synergistaceae bacterium]